MPWRFFPSWGFISKRIFRWNLLLPEYNNLKIIDLYIIKFYDLNFSINENGHSSILNLDFLAFRGSNVINHEIKTAKIMLILCKKAKWITQKGDSQGKRNNAFFEFLNFQFKELFHSFEYPFFWYPVLDITHEYLDPSEGNKIRFFKNVSVSICIFLRNSPLFYYVFFEDQSLVQSNQFISFQRDLDSFFQKLSH